MAHSVVIEGVSKRYGTTLALDDVTFSVAAGEFVALLGPSGAGKSTLFRCVTGLVKPDAGRLQVLGREISALRTQEMRQARREVGLIFQQFNLIGRLSAMDNVLAGRMGHAPTWRVMLRRFSRADRQLALAALDRVGLLERYGQRADSLSGGQQQRVAIARVLAQQARLFLADEPVSSLDPTTAENVLGILRNIARESGISVICALHQVELARRYADRVIALKGGKKLLDAEVQAFDREAFQKLYGTETA